MWESRAVLRGFSKQLWESASRKSCRRPPIYLRISIAAAFSTSLFLFLFWFFFLFLFVTSFPCGKPAGSRYESATLLCQRLEETFERDRHGELDICSDDVLRGLRYKDYGHSLPASFLTRERIGEIVDVETERRNRRIYRIGLGRPKARRYPAGGG